MGIIITPESTEYVSCMVTVQNVLPQYSGSIEDIVDNLNLLRSTLSDGSCTSLKSVLPYADNDVDEEALRVIVTELEEGITSSGAIDTMFREDHELLVDIPDLDKIDYASYQLLSIDNNIAVIGII